jgi:hypothetical protein
MKYPGNILKKGAIIAGLVLLSGFISCKPEKENLPPEAIQQVSSLYGEAPLNVNIKLTGTDPDGIEDIVEYREYVNGALTKSKTPLDLTKTFTEPGIYNIYGEVFDSESQSDKTEVTSVEVVGKPFINQSVSLSEDANIK